MTKNVYWIFRMDVADGKQDELREVAAELCEIVRAEDGVVAYEWSTSSDGKQLHIHERWATAEAAIAHAQSVGQHLSGLLAIATPTGCDCYGDMTEAFREAVKDFGMTFHAQIAGFIN